MYDKYNHLVFEEEVEEYLQVKDVLFPKLELKEVDFSEIPVILDVDPLKRIERWIAYSQTGYILKDSKNNNPPEMPEVNKSR